MKKFIGIVAALALLASSPMHLCYGAFGIDNTGTGDWKYSSGPVSPTGDAVVVTTHTGWTSPELAGVPWVSANSNGTSSIPSGNYTYTLTFTIPNWVDLSSVVISGNWSSDNASDAYLGDATTGSHLGSLAYGAGTPSDPYSFQTSASFLISNLASYTNTLTFVVNNATTGPSALAVAFNETQFTAIPEPTTLVVWSGLAAIGGIVAYRRRVVA